MGCKQSKGVEIKDTLPNPETAAGSPTITESFRPQITRAFFKHATKNDWLSRLSNASFTHGDELYMLIRNEDYDAAIDLLNAKQNGGNDQLLQRIGSQDYSPLMAILDVEEVYGRLSESARKLCFRLIEIGGKDLLKKCSYEGTALHYSFLRHRPCQALLRKLIDVGGKELVLMTNHSNNHTALHQICDDYFGELFYIERDETLFRSKQELVHVLLDIGGKELALMTDKDGNTALHLTIQNNMEEMEEGNNQTKLKVVESLLKTGGEELTFIQDRFGFTALHCSYSYEADVDTQVIRHLLEVGGERLALIGDANGKTALHRAIEYGFGHQLLLEFGGAKLALVADRDGYTALHDLNNGYDIDPEAIRHMLEVGGEDLVFSTNRFGHSPLHHIYRFMAKFHPDIVRQILDIGGKKFVFMTDGIGRTLLHCACLGESGSNDCDIELNPDFNDLLLDIGGASLVMVPDNCGRTALHYACDWALEGSVATATSDDTEVASQSSLDSEEASQSSVDLEATSQGIDPERSRSSDSDHHPAAVSLRSTASDELAGSVLSIDSEAGSATIPTASSVGQVSTLSESPQILSISPVNREAVVRRMDESRRNIDSFLHQSHTFEQERQTDLETDTLINNSSRLGSDSDSIPNRSFWGEVEDSISSETDQSSRILYPRSNKTETILQLLDLGHMELFMKKDHIGQYASTAYIESGNTSQDVIDRFVEIGGEFLSM